MLPMSSLTKYYDDGVSDTDRTPAQPRYLAIADDLRIQIATGELRPGDELPTLGDLSERYGVSDGIARQALQLLRQQALITRGRGRRSVVRGQRRSIAASNRRALTDKLLVREDEETRRGSGTLENTTGESVHDHDLDRTFTRVTATAETPGFEPGTHLLHRVYETTDKETGLLLLWSQSWLPLDLIESNPNLLDRRGEELEPWPGGTQHQLYTVGLEVMRQTSTVTTRPATTVEAARWGMEPSDPVIIVTGVDHGRAVGDPGAELRVIASGQSVYPGDRSSLEFVTELPSFAQLDTQTNQEN